MPLALNRFPIEILRMIFDYFWAHEILYMFFNINDHFNRILFAYDQYRINFQSIRKTHFDLVCRLIRPEQVISLILADQKQTPCQSQLFQTLFRIEKFTRLRSLKLIELADDGQSLLSKLYKLQRLVSLEINIRFDLPLIKALPPIKTLIINLPSDVQFDIRRSIGSLSLEYVRHLSISYCSFGAFLHFFNEMPQLKSFKTSLFLWKPMEVNLFAYIHKIQITPVDLVSLSLTIDAPALELTNHHFELFLTPFQRLQQFELIIKTYLDHEFLNANHWEKLIVEHLPKLMTFNFKFPASFDEREIIDRFRSPFWLNKHWFVAFDSQSQRLFTVPHFASTETRNSIQSVSSDWTTLPLEQHSIFYDRVNQLKYESGQSEHPYRYNHVKKLIFNDPYMYDNIVDLSKIKTAMPCVNYLRLNCSQTSLRNKYFPDISLPQIRRLSLPQFGRRKEKIQFNWSKVFPCVERLTASINSKNQIVFLIDHFNNMLDGFFVLDEYHFDKIKITREWLKQHSCRLKREKKENGFACEINDKYSFSLCLWMSENK
ncbi:unnamed protein product [Rotaria socialis]|uniref:F-box domain-containing protein n=1 Tax=Rotaria socialis TaxID=392032 RepID=A0A820T0L6_9BILA|nr:unnamed protein product [Rotaria socialis]CAF4186602.1 unnamed protein product [Rotaria socialis]CAF4327861.1 unnamed protein product [Rotaria socialis]CAF4467113.1 unnamed protein product [Rotaria socialis]